MKSMILVLALLIFGPLLADIHIQTRVAHTKRTQNSFDLNFNAIDNRYARLSIGDDCAIEYAIIFDDGENLVFAVKVFQKNNKDEFVLVADSVFSIASASKKNAYVRFGKKDAAGEIVEDRLITFVVRRDVDCASDNTSDNSNVIDTDNSAHEAREEVTCNHEVVVTKEMVREEVMAGQGEVVREQGEETVSNE